VAAAPVAPGLPVDDTDNSGRVNDVPDDQMASHKQIAADLLPEAGDSWAVDGGEGL